MADWILNELISETTVDVHVWKWLYASQANESDLPSLTIRRKQSRCQVVPSHFCAQDSCWNTFFVFVSLDSYGFEARRAPPTPYLGSDLQWPPEVIDILFLVTTRMTTRPQNYRFFFLKNWWQHLRVSDDPKESPTFSGEIPPPSIPQLGSVLEAQELHFRSFHIFKKVYPC